MVAEVQREKALTATMPSSTSSLSTGETIPAVGAENQRIKTAEAQPNPRVVAPQFDLPFEGIREFALAQIWVDPEIQVRAKIHTATVEEYAKLMRNGTQFPPVVVFAEGQTYRLADGFHRLEAARLAKLPSIIAEIKSGDRVEALRYALGANLRHGLRRTNADKRRCVEIALKEFAGLSDRVIAEMCGVGNALVSVMRRQVCDPHTSSARTGRDGKSYSTAKSPRHENPAEPISVAGSGQVQEPNTASQKSLPASVRQEGTAEVVDATPSAVSVIDVNHLDVTDVQAETERTVGAATSSPELSSVELRTSSPTASTPLVLSTNTPSAVQTIRPLSGVEIAAFDGANFIPPDKIQQAVSAISHRDFAGPVDSDLAVHARRMVPMIAEILNRYAREFPEVDGHDLCWVSGRAITKLQVCMKWT